MRLIDADALKKAIIKQLCVKSVKYLLPAEKSIYDLIDKQPTIELLKAEQPRIMRLPEAMGIYDPVFAEFKKMDGDTFTKWVDAVISDDARHVKVTDLYCIIPTIRDMEYDFNLYNKRFRFWSKKPTDEQMASEPWN